MLIYRWVFVVVVWVDSVVVVVAVVSYNINDDVSRARIGLVSIALVVISLNLKVFLITNAIYDSYSYLQNVKNFQSTNSLLNQINIFFFIFYNGL